MSVLSNVHYETAEYTKKVGGGYLTPVDIEYIQAEATLAIAYEARTQTLLALRAQSEDETNKEELLKEILERLYG
jgi:hypothetical protein